MNADILILLSMVGQILWPMVVKKIGAPGAAKAVPLLNMVVSLTVNLAAGFIKAAGGTPTVEPSNYQQAGLFGNFGNVFIDALVNSLLQTFLVTGAHSAPKNTVQLFKK